MVDASQNPMSAAASGVATTSDSASPLPHLVAGGLSSGSRLRAGTVHTSTPAARVHLNPLHVVASSDTACSSTRCISHSASSTVGPAADPTTASPLPIRKLSMADQMSRLSRVSALSGMQASPTTARAMASGNPGCEGSGVGDRIGLQGIPKTDVSHNLAHKLAHNSPMLMTPGLPAVRYRRYRQRQVSQAWSRHYSLAWS